MPVRLAVISVMETQSREGLFILFRVHHYLVVMVYFVTAFCGYTQPDEQNDKLFQGGLECPADLLLIDNTRIT